MGNSNQSARVVLYALAVCLVVVVALGYAAGQAGQTGADTLKTTASPKASAFVAETSSITRANLAFAATVAQAIEDKDLEAARALAVEQAADWNQNKLFGDTVTDDYRLVAGAFYNISSAVADQAAKDYAEGTGSPDEGYAFAVPLNNYTSSFEAQLASAPSQKTIGAGFVGQALAATSNKAKGKAVAASDKKKAAASVAAAKKAKAEADKKAKAAADALAAAEAAQATADKAAAERAAAEAAKKKPEWAVVFQATENDVPTDGFVNVVEEGTKALKYNQEVSKVAPSTLLVAQGNLSSFSGYRLNPFALFAGGGAPPTKAWDKTAEPTHAPINVPIKTIANWTGSQTSVVIPILDRVKRSDPWWKKALKTGERIGRRVIGDGVKQKIVIIGQSHGVGQEDIDAITKDIDAIDAGDAISDADNQPLSAYDKNDDFILALAGQPSMKDGVMSMTIKTYGNQSDASTYAGYNMGSVDLPAQAIVLNDVISAKIGDKQYFIFQHKPIILTVTTDKHDKKNETAKQAFASADGNQTTKTVKIKLRVRVLVDQTTNQTSMEYAYKLAPYSLNAKQYPASKYPLPEFSTRATNAIEVGTIANQAAGTKDDFSNF